MKIGSVKYLIGEGFKNVWVNRLMTIASVGVLVACMVIIGFAILLTENVNMAVGQLEQQNVVMAYMKDYSWALYDDDARKDNENSSTTQNNDDSKPKDSDYIIHNEAEGKKLCEEIAKLDNIASVEYVSGEEGLEDIKQSMAPGQEEYFNFLDEDNPLSAAAKITMKDMSLFKQTIEEIEKIEGVDKIQSQTDLAEKITALKKGITVAGVWIIAILVIIALVIVSNTIRVTMYNRKLEISIMKAVGATDAFVRMPFVVEGMIMGIISAIIAEVLLYFCYRVATETIVAQLGAIIEYGDLAWWLLLIFIGLGVLSGIIGSVIMIGKYLKHEGSEFTAI